VTPLFVARCNTCGTSYTAERWAALELKGEQKVEADETGPAETLELRNCGCGSTLAIPLAPK
jgi:hypothetical protein